MSKNATGGHQKQRTKKEKFYMNSLQGMSNSQLKLIKSLGLKKFRQKNNLFVAEGRKVIQELALSEWRVKSCWLLDKDSLNISCENIFEISTKELAQASFLQHPHFGLALVEIPFYEPFTSVENIQLVVDGIKDPGNLGSIIRLCDWYGLSELICTNDSVDAYNPKVVQASMGSLFRVNVQNLRVEDIRWQSTVYGATLSGQSTHGIETIKTPCQLIIGNESRGISESLKKICTTEVSIPKFGQAESLNAAIACGIILDRMTLLTPST